jgi:tetratricopeptide (TPR) repeat protein
MVPTIISALALAVSVISAVYSFRLQKLDSRRSTREHLNEAVSELIKLNAEGQSLWSIPPHQRDQLFYQRQAVIGQTVIAVSRQAVYLAEQQPDLVTDIEYYIIAQGLVASGDFMRAEEYWHKAIKAAMSPYYKIENTRMYADFLFNQGKHEAGRAHYQEALKLFDNNTDYQKFTNAFTYQMWMVSEANHRFWEEADSNYNRARRLFESISNPYAKENGLAGLERAREGSNKLRNDSRSPAAEPGVIQAIPTLRPAATPESAR